MGSRGDVQPYVVPIPILYGFSPTVVPRPTDWPPWIHVTGYWLLDPDPSWQPPHDLQTFLHAGPPPVYVGFGSTIVSDPEALSRTVLQALEMTGQRGVLQGGWAGLKGVAGDHRVFFVEDIPHNGLFPRCAAIIHHGGAGTTAEGFLPAFLRLWSPSTSISPSGRGAFMPSAQGHPLSVLCASRPRGWPGPSRRP